MNKFVLLLMMSALVFSVISYSNGNKIKIYLDDNPIKFHKEIPRISATGRTLVPLKIFAQYLGARLEWKAEKKLLILTKNQKKITMRANYNEVIINNLDKSADSHVVLDSEVVIIDEIEYAPARFIAETLGYKVKWDKNSKGIIKIISKP